MSQADPNRPFDCADCWAGLVRCERHRLAHDKPTQLLEKHQPCGCIVCTCADDVRCHGCGARHCGTHPVSEIPNAVYEQPAQPGSEEAWRTLPWFQVPEIRRQHEASRRMGSRPNAWKDLEAVFVELDRLQAALTAAHQRIAALKGDSK